MMPKPASRKRADLLLVEKGLAETREQAQTLIAEGLVFNRQGRVLKPSSTLLQNEPLDVRGGLPYVSRGGVKLAHALDVFDLSPDGLTALDVGASTGGFTDCLLQRGAHRVYALDVGRGQLNYRLRRDPRVTVIEKCNARYPFRPARGRGLGDHRRLFHIFDAGDTLGGTASASKTATSPPWSSRNSRRAARK